MDAGGLAGLANGVEEGVAAGGPAELAGGAEEVVTAGGVAGVCASAPETRRGSPTSAPAIQIRSIMQQDPTRQRRASCAPASASLFPLRLLICRHRSNAAAPLAFLPITPREPKLQRPPEGGL